jgi:hypothetical protein
MEITHERLHLQVRRMKFRRVEVLFESLLPLTELLYMEMMRHFEVMLGQMPNNFVQNSSIL